MKLLGFLTIAFLLLMLAGPTLLLASEFRVWSGHIGDFTDSKGRVWYNSQRTNQVWGGWIEKQPVVSEHTTLTAAAQIQAEVAGYDVELFHAVSWLWFPDTVKYQFKTGNGIFDVTYLVGEHWSPNNRGFDIIIENNIVEPLYVTPGLHEIDIKTYQGIEVSDGTLDFHFAGNANTGAADLNAMFSALEVVPAANSEGNLTTTWDDINGDDTTYNTRNAAYKVSLIYFLPRDRAPQPDINTKLNILIKSAQQFYANEMERHGFGSKTFTFETDASGDAVVHYVYGKFTDAYYQTYDKIKGEIPKQFDTLRHVYLVVADVSSEAIGIENQSNVCSVADSSWYSSDNELWWRVSGGLVVLPASGRCFVPSIAAHELGHTFGLVHDFRDDAYLMGYGTQSRLSRCAAEWLSVHRFFTNKISFNENTTLEIHSQHDGRFQFQITDPDGLYQAQLLIPATVSDPSPGTKLHSCKALNNKTNSTVPFVVKELLAASDNKVTLQVIDVHGSIATREFPIQSTVDSKSTIVSVMPASIEVPPIGEQLTLSLNITNGVAVAGYQATLQFDNEALQYITSENGDYLADNAFFSPSVVNGNAVRLLSTVLSGESHGDGTLATLTFEVIAHKASSLTLSEVILSDSKGNTFSPELEHSEVVEPTRVVGDVNRDGIVNIADLVLVANSIGQTGQTEADVNDDGVVNIADLVLVAAKIGTGGSAPSAAPQALDLLTAVDVQLWITQAQHAGLTDAISQRGIQVLGQFLAMLLPKETALLPNYPNPFNPETWLPYQLAKPAKVTVRIYSIKGQLVRVLALGHQPMGIYASRHRAAYWDGKNEIGESVASGVYFYTLTADDFTASRRMLIQK